MSPPERGISRDVPLAFEAFEETAAYVEASVSRSRAITLGRDAQSELRDYFRRDELRAVRVWMRDVEDEEAREAFCGEFDSGWVECRLPLNEQRANLTPMWKVEPR